MTEDGERPDREWMERRGWRCDDDGEFFWDVGYGTHVMLNLFGCEFQILQEDDDTGWDNSVCVPVRCETRGDVRRIEKVFRLNTREGLL